MVLEKNGFDVLTATNSIEAVEAFKTHPISLVIADHLLGHESGLELAAALKHINPFVPIVLLSGLPPTAWRILTALYARGKDRKRMSILRDLLHR